MDQGTTITIITLYAVAVFCGGIVVLCMKDIIIALKRLFKPRGCDVYIINQSRQMLHLYSVPKDGRFIINEKTYITNPNKILNLDEKTSQKVSAGLKKRRENIELLIKSLDSKQNEYASQIKKLTDDKRTEGLSELNAAIETISQRINLLKEDLESGEEYFYHRKRATFFYIEGDPVPKNLFDNYSEVDCNIIDNLIASCLTADAKLTITEIKKLTNGIKLWLYISAGAGVVACLILIQLIQKGVKCIGAV